MNRIWPENYLSSDDWFSSFFNFLFPYAIILSLLPTPVKFMNFLKTLCFNLKLIWRKQTYIVNKDIKLLLESTNARTKHSDFFRTPSFYHFYTKITYQKGDLIVVGLINSPNDSLMNSHLSKYFPLFNCLSHWYHGLLHLQWMFLSLRLLKESKANKVLVWHHLLQNQGSFQSI